MEDSSPEVSKHRRLVRGESTAQLEPNTVPAPAASAMGSEVTEKVEDVSMKGSEKLDDGETSPIAPTEPEDTPDKLADSPQELPDRPRVHREDQRTLKELQELKNPKVKKVNKTDKPNPKGKAKGRGKGKKPTLKRPASKASAQSKKRQRLPKAKAEEEQEGKQEQEGEEEEALEMDEVAVATQHYSPHLNPQPRPCHPRTWTQSSRRWMMGMVPNMKRAARLRVPGRNRQGRRTRGRSKRRERVTRRLLLVGHLQRETRPSNALMSWRKPITQRFSSISRALPRLR